MAARKASYLREGEESREGRWALPTCLLPFFFFFFFVYTYVYQNERRILVLFGGTPWPINNFFFQLAVKGQLCPSLNGLKIHFCPSKITGFHILPSLKKFRPRNLRYSSNSNQTIRNFPLLKIVPRISINIILNIKPITSSLEFPRKSHNLKCHSTIHLNSFRNSLIIS